MAINLRGGGNLLTQMLMMGLENQNRQKEQQRSQQFTTQRDIQQRQFSGQQAGLVRTEEERLRLAGIEEEDRIRRLGQTETERVESREERLDREARGRKETIIRQEGEVLSAQKIEDDKAGERYMKALGMVEGVDYDPNDVHTLSGAKDLGNAWEKRNARDSEVPGLSEYEQFTIDQFAQAYSTMSLAEYEEYKTTGQGASLLERIDGEELRLVDQAILRNEIENQPEPEQTQLPGTSFLVPGGIPEDFTPPPDIIGGIGSGLRSLIPPSPLTINPATGRPNPPPRLF